MAIWTRPVESFGQVALIGRRKGMIGKVAKPEGPSPTGRGAVWRSWVRLWGVSKSQRPTEVRVDLPGFSGEAFTL